jgi:hypothetical protein
MTRPRRNVPGVVVGHPAAGSECERLVGDACHQLRERNRPRCFVLDVRPIEVFRQSARVREQLPQRQFAGMRRIGKVFRQLVVDIEFGVFLQLQDCRCGELLGDRADFVERVDIGRKPALEVANSVGFAIDDPIIPDDGYDRTWRPGAVEYRADVRIDLFESSRVE